MQAAQDAVDDYLDPECNDGLPPEPECIQCNEACQSVEQAADDAVQAAQDAVNDFLDPECNDGLPPEPECLNCTEACQFVLDAVDDAAVPGVNCPSAAKGVCAALVPLDRAALVVYDDWGLALANPAVGGAAFRVIVLGLPGNARHVELYGDDRLIERQDVDLLQGPSTYNSAAMFENVPLLASNSYSVSIVDGSNSDIATESLSLWRDARQLIYNPGANDPGTPNGPSGPGPDAPEGPGNPTPNCAGPGATYAAESDFAGAEDDNGNGYDVDYAALYQRALARTWDWGTANSCGATPNEPCTWGFANNYYGRSWMVGSGPQEFGFTNDYAGCGSDWRRHSPTTEPVGHSVVVSHATSFMVNPPEKLAASYTNLDQVSIPASSTTNPPAESQFLLTAMDALIDWLNSETLGAIPAALDYVSPGLVDEMTANWVRISAGPFDQQGGGGIDVKVATPNQKMVTGIHHWDFNGEGKFEWELQSSAYMDGYFNACSGCGVQGNSYTVMVKHYRSAQLTRQAPGV